MAKVDETTVALQFPEPYPLFLEVLGGGNTQLGAGQATRGDIMGGVYAPAHYLKQFHPKYTPQADIDKVVQEAKFDNWVNLFKFKINWRLNVELPTLGPLADRLADQHAGLGAGAEPVLLRGRSVGNQLPVLRQDPADPG